MGPRTGLDGCEKTRPPPGFEPRTFQPIASHYTDCAIPAQLFICIYIYIYVVHLLIINCTRCTVHTPQLNYKCHLLLKHSFRTICNCAYIGLLTSPGVASVTARDLRLPPRCGCDLPSSWVLRCVISQKGAELNMSLRHIIFIVTCLFRVHLNAIQHYIRDV